MAVKTLHNYGNIIFLARCLVFHNYSADQINELLTFNTIKMKKSALIVAFILTILSPLAAAESKESTTNYTYYNEYGETFTFVERGITFSVFQNGEFDFYINPRDGVHVGVNLANVSLSYNSGYDYDAYVQYDDYGAIIQIEDIPIYYDYYGRISQAGNVRIHYNGQRLARIGGLYIHYNRFGVYSHYTGFINRWNRRYVFHPYHNYFVRPVFNRCIVSYNPYRRWYRPIRYDYYRGRGYARGYRYKNYRRDGRSFRSIDARVRTNNDGRRVARRFNDARRSNDRDVGRNEGVRRSTQQRSVQRNRNQSAERRSQGIRRSDSRVTQRRTNEVRRNNSARTQQNRSVQRRSSSPRVAEQRRTIERRSTPRVAEQRRTVQRSSKPRVQSQNRTVQRRSQSQARTQTRKAPQRSVAQRKNNNTRKYSSRKQTTVRKQSSNRATQRNGNRRVNSRRSL